MVYVKKDTTNETRCGKDTESESRESSRCSFRRVSRLIIWELWNGWWYHQPVIVIDAPLKKPLLFFDAVIGHKLMLFSLLFYYFLLFCLDREGKIALHTHQHHLTKLPSLSSVVVMNVHANFPHTV